jgi:hypothetical protein
MANPDAFLRSQPGSRNYDTHSSPYQRMSAVPPPASSPSQMPPNGHDFRQQSFPKGVPVPSPTMTSTTSGQFPRPALKAQYLQPIQVQGQGQAHSQQHQQSQQPQPNPQRLQKPQETAQTPNQNSKLKTATVFKPYKIPPKESPVPLPANFLAAMTSTPNTAAATAGQPALQQPSNKGSPVEPKPARKVQATQQPPLEVHTPGRQPLGAKISKTPVPIPRLPGFMPVSTSREQAALTQKHVPNQEQSNCRLPSYQGSPVTPVATQEQTASSVRDGKLVLTNTNQENAPQTVLEEQAIPWDQQDFPDVPGSESMKFMDSLLENIRTIARRDEKP